MASILVVDDDMVLNQLLSEILIYEGFDVVSAHSGRDALAILEGLAPDAIVLDLEMPGISARSVHRRWEERTRIERQPRLVGLSSMRATANGATGADVLLRKPFPIPRLVSVLSELLIREPGTGELIGSPASAV